MGNGGGVAVGGGEGGAAHQENASSQAFHVAQPGVHTKEFGGSFLS